MFLVLTTDHAFCRVLQLRGKYFDRIERSEVVAALDSVFEWVESLEDMQFLVRNRGAPFSLFCHILIVLDVILEQVQYAAQVLPETPQEATGECIWNNILQLQHELTGKRTVSRFSLSTPFIVIPD